MASPNQNTERKTLPIASIRRDAGTQVRENLDTATERGRTL